MTGERCRRAPRIAAVGCSLAVLAMLAACSGSPAPDDATGSAPAVSNSPPATAQPPTAQPPTAQPTSAEPTESAAAFDAHAVSAGHPAAVEAGLVAIEEGGNAVDAAVSSAFVMTVVEPFSSGMGGGGAALVAPPPAGGPAQYYDYREVVAADGIVPASDTGVPGFVAGLAELHADHGELDWAQVVSPAAELAAEGHPVSGFLAEQLRTGPGRAATSGLAHFTTDGMPLEEGDPLVQAELAESLELVAAQGPEAFYAGELSPALTGMEGIDAGSLAAYRVQRSAPVRGPLGDYEVLSAAPALAGVALIQLLQVAEAMGVADTEPGSAEFVDLTSRAWRVADQSVATELGDPAFVDVPVERLTDPDANAELAPAAITSAGLPDPVAAAPPTDTGPGNTTHLSVVDEDGLTVSMTNTILSFWGSGRYAGGFFLNNTLTRFDLGTTEANVPSPGRRPASWMAPTVLLDDAGRPVLVLGTPGGRQIPTVLAGVILRWALHDQPLQEAVSAPRFHLEGEVLRVEGPSAEVAAELGSRGYVVEEVPASARLFGSVQALELDHEAARVTGATDSRREGAWDSREVTANQD